MCGIFGWLPSTSFQRNNAQAAAWQQCELLRHRGPNDRGFMVFPVDKTSTVLTERDAQRDTPFRLLLGQTRLSIIDLSPAGHQPMSTMDGRFTMVYNGEVYNYKELCGELEAEGLSFRTQTDTEVVLQALIHWGERALSRFTGMFALALHDAVEDTLFLARDFFGIKPLYWQWGENGFCFASELPALLAFPAVQRKVDPHAAYQFLCYGQYDCGTRTFVDGVEHLPAGHVLKVSLRQQVSKPVPQRFWAPDISKRSTLSFADAAEQLRGLFLDSVRMHLRSDVPLGVALSGGIDSSATTCAMRHIEPDIDIHTFSFIAKGHEVSEEQWASQVGHHVGAVRHIVEASPDELTNDIDKMIMALGEPFLSTSIYAQYRVFQLTRECGITVTLDGQGADELLAGYQGYPGPRMSTLLRAGHWHKAWQFYAACKKWPGRTASFLMQQTAREFVPSWLTPLALRCVGRSNAPSWLMTEQLQSLNIPLVREDLRDRLYPCSEKVHQTLAYQLTWNGLPQLLRHGDRNAMAHSIESRVPFLTREMAEFCLSLPEEYLIDMHGCSKSVFREAMRGIVPDVILDRRDKIGFATPEKDWLFHLSEWVEDLLGNAKDVPYLHVDKAQLEWQNIRSGKSAFDWRVWCWLCYVRWIQLFKITS